MFDAQIQMWAVTAQIEVGVPPGVEFGRPPERLATTFMGGAFAGMVHQHYRSAVVALQAAQISEQWGDLGSEVLVDTVETNQRVEHKQFGFEAGDRGVKRPLLFGVIEPKGRRGDDMDVEAVEVGAGGRGDALEALSHDLRGILGGEQQDGATLSGHEVAQAGVPEATETARSNARKDFPHLGSPPIIPTACALHRPSISHISSSGCGVASCAARVVGRAFMDASPQRDACADREGQRPQSRASHRAERGCVLPPRSEAGPPWWSVPDSCREANAKAATQVAAALLRMPPLRQDAQDM